MSDNEIDLTGPVERASEWLVESATPGGWQHRTPIEKHDVREWIAPLVKAAFEGDEFVRYVEVPR